MIRDARASDLEAILAIINRAIRDSSTIWVEDEFDRANRERWLAEQGAAGHPVLIAEIDGVVAGYASYGPWRSQPGFRYTVEDSVYVSQDFKRRGVGRALLEELIVRARDAGLRTMIAAIDASNTASIALHEKLGFDPPVVLPEVGVKYGAWLDLGLMRLDLGSFVPGG